MGKCKQGFKKIGSKCVKVFNKSSSDYNVISYDSIGFTGLLTLLFIGLKLTGYISWSWWWVLSPIWLSIALVLGLGILFGVIMWIFD